MHEIYNLETPDVELEIHQGHGVGHAALMLP